MILGNFTNRPTIPLRFHSGGRNYDLEGRVIAERRRRESQPQGELVGVYRRERGAGR